MDELIASRRPGDYDQAVHLLKDLKDVGLRTGRAGEVDARVRRLRHLHAGKRTLVERLARAGLVSLPEAGR